MTETRTPRRARWRRVLSVALVGLLTLGGGTALALSNAQPASAAPSDVYFDTPEYTVATHSPFQFDGHATPGDAVTIDVDPAIGLPCHANADIVTGAWSCLMTFTASTDVTVLTVSRDVDDLDPATQESDGQEHSVSLPLIINETSPGNVLSNASPPALTGSGAFPGAAISGTIGAQLCAGVATVTGTWTCTSPAQLDGIYPSGVQQDVLGGGLGYSDTANTMYTKDATAPPWPESSTPYDSTLGADTGQTSDVTPSIGGGIGSAEPNTTVNVAVEDRGALPLVWPGPSAAITPYCSAVADGTGSWSCTGAPLTVGRFYVATMTGVDQAGNGTSGSPDADFGIEILPPPAAPLVGSFGVPGELSPIDVNGNIDAATTEVRVREGATDLCGPIVPTFPTFTCAAPVALAPGAHTLDVTAYDVYGTGTTTSVGVVTWPNPVIDTPLALSQTSQSTVHITGDSPIGSILQVRVDGVIQPGCTGLVAGIPEFDCMSGLVGVGPHNVTAQFTDPNTDPSALVNQPFTIVLGPVPVVVSAPTIGYTSTDPVVHVAFTGQPPGTTYVQEGATVLCAPAALAVSAYACDTIPLSVGVHNLSIAQYDQYGTLSTAVNRVVTILPSPVPKPLSMKTFGFSFSVTNPDGSPIDPAGLGTGDLVTVEATGVPPGTQLITEIHSTPIELGSQLVGGTGVMRLTTEVPVVPPGPHEIVVTASGPGYFPAAFSQPFAVHGLKQITDPADIVKELGEPDAVKELGVPADETGATAGAGGPGGSNAHGFGDPSQFGSSVDSPFDAPAHAFALSPAGIVLSGAIAIAFLLLVGLPAELLESTIRSNYDRAFGWLTRLRRRVSRMLAPVARILANPWVGTGLTILAASVLLGFADPDFGFTGASVRLVLAMMLAVVTINIGLSLVVMKVARQAFDVAAVLKPMPAALAIVGVSVLVSRLAGISPGFLFGIVLGIAYARELKLRDEARLGVLGVGLTIGAGLVAWLGYGFATAAISGQGFFNNLLIEALAAITLEALGTLVVALLPIEFLDGRTIFRWSKLAWLGLYAITALVFLFVVVPLSDNWGTMTAPVFGWGTLFAVFAAVAIITWAVFRRRSRVRPSTPEAAEPRQRSRR
jgi:hypothetical protein